MVINKEQVIQKYGNIDSKNLLIVGTLKSYEENKIRLGIMVSEHLLKSEYNHLRGFLDCLYRLDIIGDDLWKSEHKTLETIKEAREMQLRTLNY